MGVIFDEQSGSAVATWCEAGIVNFVHRLVPSRLKANSSAMFSPSELLLMPCSAMTYDVDEFVSFRNRRRRIVDGIWNSTFC